MVYIKYLNKRIFPYYIPPEEDELFSSWFCRLSLNHHIKTESFSQNYLGRGMSITNRDIDLLAPSELLKTIEKHTPLNLLEIQKMFLVDYKYYAFEKMGKKGSFTENILSLGIIHRKRKRFGLSFCPSCLNKSGYYRKKWRLVTSLICIDCHQYLLDRCFKCHQPVIIHRVNMSNNISIIDYKPIYLCHNCNQDLREYTPTLLPLNLEIEYQKFIDLTIKQGYNSICSYSFYYIRTLLYLSKRLNSNKKGNRFRDGVIANHKKKDHFPFIDEAIQYWNISQRLETLPFIYKLLNNQELLERVFIEGRVSKSYLDGEKILPYWIYEKGNL